MEIKLNTPIECTMQQCYSAQNLLPGYVMVRKDWKNKKFYIKLMLPSAEKELREILS